MSNTKIQSLVVELGRRWRERKVEIVGKKDQLVKSYLGETFHEEKAAEPEHERRGRGEEK